MLSAALDNTAIMQLKATNAAFASLNIVGFLLALLIGYLTSSIHRYQGSPNSVVAMFSAICFSVALSSEILAIAAICILFLYNLRPFEVISLLLSLHDISHTHFSSIAKVACFYSSIGYFSICRLAYQIAERYAPNPNISRARPRGTKKI